MAREVKAILKQPHCLLDLLIPAMDNLVFPKDMFMAPNHDIGFAIPAALAAELQAAADEEHRPPLDVLRDAIESYRKEQRWRRTLAYGADRARESGLTEADVPRLIAEHRQEKRKGLQSG